MLPSKPSSPIGCGFEDRRHVIGGGKRIGVAEADERPVLGAVDEAHRRLQNDGAGPFGADQRAGDVKTVFRQELIEVVAGHPPRNLRESRRGSRPRSDRGSIADRA